MSPVLDRVRSTFQKRIVGHAAPARRLLEWAAVRTRFRDRQSRAPVLTGPEGSGRGALARALAEGLGLPLRRVVVAGLCARDLRGWPPQEGGERGVLLNRLGIRPGGMVLLDGIDRLDGARAALALRTLLDPRASFQDRCAGEEVRLGQAFCIATAVDPTGIPDPLHDRFEPIPLLGYDPSEKAEIARRHLIPQALSALGLGGEAVEVRPDAIERLASVYAPEAGVRGLRRLVGTLARRAAARLALGGAGRVVIGQGDLEELLGPPPDDFPAGRTGRTGDVGEALGLIWTPEGGRLALVEALPQAAGRAALPAEGTGEGGGVRRAALESALACLGRYAETLNIHPDALEDAQVLVRASLRTGLIAKPHEGLDLPALLAVASVATDRPVRHDLAAVGGVSLRGAVRDVPGLAAMVHAAVRRGVRSVLVPASARGSLERALAPSTLAAVELTAVPDALTAIRRALLDVVIARAIR